MRPLKALSFTQRFDLKHYGAGLAGYRSDRKSSEVSRAARTRLSGCDTTVRSRSDAKMSAGMWRSISFSAAERVRKNSTARFL